MSLTSIADDYLDYLELEKNASKRTLTNYRHYLDRFLDFADEKGVTEPEKLTMEVIKSYRLWLNREDEKTGETKLKKITQNYHLIALRTFLKFCAKRDIPTLAAEKIELMEPEAREINILNIEQLEEILKKPDLATLPGKRDRALMECLFSTGLRVSEVVSLNRSQIDLERREFS